MEKGKPFKFDEVPRTRRTSSSILDEISDEYTVGTAYPLSDVDEASLNTVRTAVGRFNATHDDVRLLVRTNCKETGGEGTAGIFAVDPGDERYAARTKAPKGKKGKKAA